MVRNARRRALKSGVPFMLEREDISVPDRCPALGVPFTPENPPSLDRIIPEMGYVPGNVIVVSLRANNIKTNATPSEIAAVAAFYHDLHMRRQT